MRVVSVCSLGILGALCWIDDESWKFWMTIMFAGVGVLSSLNTDDDFLEPKSITQHFENDQISADHGELGYLHTMRRIIEQGHRVLDRTGTGGNRFLPGVSVKYDISNFTIPLLTTRVILWRNVVEELLFFLKGKTDTKELEAKNVNIWKANSSKEFLASQKLPYPEGTIGPMYGFQWRHFNAEYKGPHADYSGQGTDQIQYILKELKTNPNSRRMLITAWNPNQLNDGVLPPCHFSAQWTHHDGILDCILYQRSCDFPLGGPTNIASYALLTHIFCHYTNLVAGTLTHMIGHAHVYENQVEKAMTHISRVPTKFPTLSLQNMPDSLEALEMHHLQLVGYTPQASIKYPFST